SMGIYDTLLKTEQPAKREPEHAPKPQRRPASSPTPPQTGSQPVQRQAATPPAQQQPGSGLHIRVRARTHAPIDDLLERVVSSKRHLTSYTFRFSGQELDDLERIKADLNADRDLEISKNDVVRLAIQLLLKQLSPDQ
ncbi:MAG: hypothetical protein M3R24_33370, partial [Chloroflexota bacterium]|nr:hypothetical protein [Chloroflexota bacterium]